MARLHGASVCIGAWKLTLSVINMGPLGLQNSWILLEARLEADLERDKHGSRREHDGGVLEGQVDVPPR